ncbi:MAG TPA: ABC transporter permease [Phototrophicaceae bacterium]|jgi:lipopolysaccharide transport system permease protein|nr:ABC transporter permease [Phototrophicaceae bacterium]
MAITGSTPDTLNPAFIKTIKPVDGWISLNLGELWQYREMLWFLIWRDLKVRYKQTVLGMFWAIIQPFVTMIVFSFVFGRLAKLPSDGIPYPLFSFVGLLPWNFFSNGLSKASTSMTNNSSLIKKIYFPRIILPITSIASGFIDMGLSFVMLLLLMVYYWLTIQNLTGALHIYPVANPELVYAKFAALELHFQITGNIIWLPALLLLAFISSLGISLWFAALNVYFRDVGQAMTFITRIGMYVTPVIYPISALPHGFRTLAALNPMTGVVEGFRWALLGTDTAPQPTIIIAALISIVLLVSGAFYFRRAESKFADLV